jgi:hypothetical protein
VIEATAGVIKGGPWVAFATASQRLWVADRPFVPTAVARITTVPATEGGYMTDSVSTGFMGRMFWKM